MQNIIKRTQRAVQRATRRSNRKMKESQKLEKAKYIKEKQMLRAMTIQDIAASRRARVEDWNLGPLAPNRAVGRFSGKYGALTDRQITPAQVPEHMRRKLWPIVEGDRVLIMKGVDKGKIGTVSVLHKESEMVTIMDMNLAYVDGARFTEDGSEPTSTPKREFPVPIPYDDIRLVHKWHDERTGETKDVIVENIKMHPRRKEPAFRGFKQPKGYAKDPETGERLYDRFVPGEGSLIPWPEEKKVPPQDYEGDTLRITVEQNTYIPTLLIPPMPETVIDELRSKYSKFRTRHDEEYVEKMTAIDESVHDQEELLAQMRTPLQEYRIRRLQEKEQAPPKVLTDEMLARIGQVMAASKAAGKAKPVVKVDRDS